MFFEIPAAAAVATTRDKTMQLCHNKNTNCLFELYLKRMRENQQVYVCLIQCINTKLRGFIKANRGDIEGERPPHFFIRIYSHNDSIH